MFALFLLPFVILLSGNNKIVNIYAANTDELFSVIVKKYTLVELMASPSESFQVLSYSFIPCSGCIS